MTKRRIREKQEENRTNDAQLKVVRFKRQNRVKEKVNDKLKKKVEQDVVNKTREAKGDKNILRGETRIITGGLTVQLLQWR